MTPGEKGHVLEIAVHTIETVILASSPALQGQPFEIERRKIVTVGGVHHEIDIYVTVGAAKGYESVFIFECKNWEAPVPKDQLIVFSEKIDATVAQRGYFVAKHYTKDAVAQAAKDPRITMLSATEYDPTHVPPPNGFHFTAPASAKCSTTFRVRGTAGTKFDVISVAEKMVRIRGVALPLPTYLNAWMNEIYPERLLHFFTAHLPAGVHPMVEQDERTFLPGECFIDDREMEHVLLEVDFGVEIIRPAVISDFEVATRGRVVRLATTVIHDVAMDVSYVTTFTD